MAMKILIGSVVVFLAVYLYAWQFLTMMIELTARLAGY